MQQILVSTLFGPPLLHYFRLELTTWATELEHVQYCWLSSQLLIHILTDHWPEAAVPALLGVENVGR